MENKLQDCIKLKKTNYTPIWFMRQAGRYMSEFREIRKNNPNFINLCLNTNLVKDLLSLGVNPREIEIKNDNPFSSKSIVITGSFSTIARSQLKEELIRVGARVSSSVSSKTDYLVVGDKPGSKLSKANELGIQILEEAEVLSLLKN